MRNSVTERVCGKWKGNTVDYPFFRTIYIFLDYFFGIIWYDCDGCNGLLMTVETILRRILNLDFIFREKIFSIFPAI